MSPHLPLSSVHNIVVAWKCCLPSFDKTSQVSHTDTTPDEGFFRRVSGKKELPWVERLGAESARECVHWVGAIWYDSLMSAILLAHDVFREVLDRSEMQSPTGSMHTIRLMASASTNSSSAISGSHPTTFLPPMDTIPYTVYPISSPFWGPALGPCLGNRRCSPALLMMVQSLIRHAGDCS